VRKQCYVCGRPKANPEYTCPDCAGVVRRLGEVHGDDDRAPPAAGQAARVEAYRLRAEAGVPLFDPRPERRAG
jgi:hypothetical protein